MIHHNVSRKAIILLPPVHLMGAPTERIGHSGTDGNGDHDYRESFKNDARVYSMLSLVNIKSYGPCKNMIGKMIK